MELLGHRGRMVPLSREFALNAPRHSWTLCKNIKPAILRGMLRARGVGHWRVDLVAEEGCDVYEADGDDHERPHTPQPGRHMELPHTTRDSHMTQLQLGHNQGGFLLLLLLMLPAKSVTRAGSCHPPLICWCGGFLDP